MPNAESVRRRSGDRRRTPPGPSPGTPKSSAMHPPEVVPHPPLYREHRAKSFRSAEKSPVAALLWTLVLGPLGLCYRSVLLGVAATAVTAGAVVAGGAAMLAVLWPAAMVAALLSVHRRS